MAAQPSDDSIHLLMELANVSRHEAVLRLKGNNNDVTTAVNEFYESPNTRGAYGGYDESQFHAERDGTTNYGNQMGFQIHAPDDRGGLSAPSRPPSRTTSPIGPVISLADEHAKAVPYGQMSQSEIEEEDLQKALAASREDAGLPPQESGVTNTNSVHFGPANRPDYVMSEWQLVVTGSGNNEPQDPEPANRRRDVGAPTFLRPSAHDNRIGSLLTIYHEIPAAREAFLNRSKLLSDYGFNKEWWRGRPVAPKRAYHAHASQPWSTSGVPFTHYQDLVHELQRLMAFLDLSDRSYGSAEALATMDIIKRMSETDVESRFFTAWKEATQIDSTFAVLFSSARPGPVFENTSEINHDTIDFAIPVLEVPPIDEYEESVSLYDLADQLLWQPPGFDLTSSPYLNHIGDIISFRLTFPPSSKQVQIPETWYPDRYLEDSRQAALDMRKQKAAARERVQKIVNTEGKLEYFTSTGLKIAPVKKLFDSSLMHDIAPEAEDISDGDRGQNLDLREADLDSEPRVGDKMDISMELKRVIASIDDKLKVLNSEKEKARISLQELSSLYTDPSASDRPLTPYLLCGVSTVPGVTYVRRQSEPNLIDMDLDKNGQTSGDQWWKLFYETSDPRPVVVVKITVEDVLAAAMEGSNASILVYASEEALLEPVQDLPEVLKAFVKADNLSFKGEFPVIPDDSLSPQSPPKRKYEDTEDSGDDLPRYDSEPRWGGQSPGRDDKKIQIMQRELMTPELTPERESGPNWGGASASESGGETITPGRDTKDVLMEVDPIELIDIGQPSLIPEVSNQGQDPHQHRSARMVVADVDGQAHKRTTTDVNSVMDVSEFDG